MPDDANTVTSRMTELMPDIHRSFKKGLEKAPLSAFVSVEQNESALNIRLAQLTWPGPSVSLEEPGGTVEKALQLCQTKPIEVATGAETELLREVEDFGLRTAETYIAAVLARLIGATKPANVSREFPYARDLQSTAGRLGAPCRVVAGARLHHFHKDISDPFVEKVLALTSWPAVSRRALVISMSPAGPWVEELDAEFKVTWESRRGYPHVDLYAAMRLYVHNEDTCYLFDPPPESLW